LILSWPLPTMEPVIVNLPAVAVIVPSFEVLASCC
jgi:hypothetical protein